MSQPQLGIHYFTDGLHFRQEDLNRWLPILQSLNLPWLILHTNGRSSIPETFVRTLVEHEIQPVLHFQSALATPPSTQEFGLLFKLYARWGIRHAVLFDRPNLRQSWPTAEWVRANPVERLLDLFIPRAEAALDAGITPVLAPLQPGGDYWDTVFLKAALLGLQQRGRQRLVRDLVLSAYGSDHPDQPTWGMGGPARWPEARPYHTPPEAQDQRGFHIAGWYLSIAEEALGIRPPLILLQVNAPTFIQQRSELPEEVLACGFWLLSADPRAPAYPHAWYSPSGQPQPGARFLQNWLNAATANLAQ